MGSGNLGVCNGLTGYSTANQFGTSSSSTSASSSTGSIFGFYGGSGQVFLSPDYVSGATLSSTSTFNNKTLASMALNPGSYTYTVPNDTITVNIGLGAVPEPASWALMLTGFGLVGGALRRRRVAVSVG